MSEQIPHAVKQRVIEADARVALLERLLAKWVTYCDLSGARPVSGDPDDHPILKLLKDSREALGTAK